jgi:hypothetical protein
MPKTCIEAPMTLRRVNNLVKDEKGDFVRLPRYLARLRNHFSPLLNVHEVNDIKQMKIHTEEPLVPELSAFEI